MAVGWRGERMCPCVLTALPPANAVCAETWRLVIVAVSPPLLTPSGNLLRTRGKDVARKRMLLSSSTGTEHRHVRAFGQ